MDIWQQQRSIRPNNQEEFILTDNLIKDALSNGFDAYVKRINLNNQREVFQTLLDLKKKNIPVIVCNQFTEEQPTIGHFRIITNIDKKSIYLHDTDPSIGGKNIRWVGEIYKSVASYGT